MIVTHPKLVARLSCLIIRGNHPFNKRDFSVKESERKKKKKRIKEEKIDKRIGGRFGRKTWSVSAPKTRSIARKLRDRKIEMERGGIGRGLQSK